MRIERIRIDAFGRLVDFDSGPRPLGNLCAVLGPNEAGKSTLFRFLTTALYGFHPASRERNPHVPWGADEAGGRVQISLTDSTCVDIDRRLRASPSGTIHQAGQAEELRNRPLPWVEHIPRTVFREVFAVTLADLVGLDAETWARVQDRIVGSMGSSDLASARAVADRLEQEASEIWRPNRRGNQRLRSLQERGRTLRGRRLEALERDRRIRALVRERDELQVRLREIRAERQEHRLAVERVQALLPVRGQLVRIDALRRGAGPPDALADLPLDPPGRLTDLDQSLDRLTSRLRDIEDAIGAPEAAIARFDAPARTLLDHADEITRFSALNAAVAPAREKAREVDATLAEGRGRLVTEGNALFEGGWDDALAEPVSRVSVALLRDRVQRVRETSPGFDGASPAVEAAGAPGSSLSHTVAGFVASIGGVAVVAWGVVSESTIAAIAGAVVGTAGLLSLVSRLGAGARAAEAGDLTAREAERRAAREALAGCMDGLPVAETHSREPTEALCESVERVQELVREQADRTAALTLARARVAEGDRAAAALSRSLGRSGEPDAETLAAASTRELREAERTRDAAEHARRELERLRRDREGAQRELEELARRRAALQELVDRAGAGDAEVAASRLQAHRRAEQLADELERAHPDLAELKARISEAERSGESWTISDDDLVRRRAHIEELEEQLERTVEKNQALERDAAHLRELETVDAVDSEIEALRDAEERLVRERDRKWVLGQLVREADRRFREAHQPDLVRRATGHLRRLTGGRYDRLMVDETGPENLFQLMGPGLPAPVALAPPISTGTLEQAYLSLRLAIVDHLDQGRERLPLFVDEVFVNWDRSRRERGLDVLAELSSDRQFFVFTCHPSVAERLERHGARVIHLEEDS